MQCACRRCYAHKAKISVVLQGKRLYPPVAGRTTRQLQGNLRLHHRLATYPGFPSRLKVTVEPSACILILKRPVLFESIRL